MKLFLDSSALVKRYINEPGTDRVNELCSLAGDVAVCILCVAEVISASNRLLRERTITRPQYRRIKKEFFSDIGETTVIDLTNAVLNHSIRCMEKSPVRSLDALHIAAAVEYGCDIFVTGDRRQKDAAASMKLTVEVV